MAIIKLNPAFKDYLWGGTKLKENFGKKTDLDIVAESWELSVHPDGPSIVASGQMAGKTFPEYLEKAGKAVWGTKGNAFENFPILIKFIDAKGSLSIQVHPDNEYAQRVEHEFGKTEMWYILDCEPGAFLYYGVNREVSKEEFEAKIYDNTVLDVLKKVPVHKGDVFFIPSGTIHAIGEGIQICEIQQNSNSTYRVYDFGRVGKDGKPRELHIQKALDVSKLTPSESDFKPCGPTTIKDDAKATMMATCHEFTTYVTELDGSVTWNVDEESFGSVIVLDGSLSIEANGEKVELEKGQTAFIDANTGNTTITGKAQFIYARV
ncbi:type I phosphomannose isomerase catalytic subunit [Floccifex sp.]|uniref:type I phosphomannose isomerase catalytic subunit n=1 Tax=Floccifex sp. TaxID=2815810 RepID=UPI003F121432